MGCQYCTWVCPYNAPKLDTEKKVMSKCTFCMERIAKGEKPYCVKPVLRRPELLERSVIPTAKFHVLLPQNMLSH